jgi:hypothetical protein
MQDLSYVQLLASLPALLAVVIVAMILRGIYR